jgi:hypothetical protein
MGVILSYIFFSCSKSITEVTPLSKNPSTLKANTMEVKYMGNTHILSYNAKATTVNYTTFKAVQVYAQDAIATTPKALLLIRFDFPLPLPSNKKYSYAKIPSEYYQDGLSLVTFFLQDQTSQTNYNIKSVTSGSLTKAEGNLEITDFQENKFIQGKFSFNILDKSGNSAEAEGIFNILF